MSTLNNIHKLSNTLSLSGHKLTTPRRLIFIVLLKQEMLTINELISATKNTIDRVSVYRTIDLFEKLGIVHKIAIGWKYKIELSELFKDHHHHLICTSCGKVYDIKDEEHLDEFINQISKKIGFKPMNHRFEVEGYCVNCN